MNVTSAPPSRESGTTSNIPTKKILLWLAMISMVMLFAGITSGYIVRKAEGNWDAFELPFDFYLSTGIILLSSASMQFAWNAIRRNRVAGLKTGLWITLGLGLAFAYTQFSGWAHLVDQKVFFAGNPSGSFLYVLTGFHLAHLIGGLIYLVVVLAGSFRMRYSAQNQLGVELCATYWHFLDALWVYLFFFLLLNG